MDLYPSFVHKGDLSPDSFGSDIDHICNEIQAACKGFGTDEKYVVIDFEHGSLESRNVTYHLMSSHFIGVY
jgi:hypothetical protein